MRKKIVAGNWKMNKTITEGFALLREVIDITNTEIKEPKTEIVACVPFVHLYGLQKMLHDASIKVKLGAQNCYHKPMGAFTGEISAEMLASVPVQYCIVGHSERRQYFQETDEQLAQKIDLLLAHNITPIFCCGETLEQREQGDYQAIVCQQLSNSLFHLSAEVVAKIVIAYEPIWAIGTGRTATSEQAQTMHATIRKHLNSQYSEAVAQEITILYGGSCNPSNAQELFACPDVDGGLIGGASLKARDFVEIIKSF